MTAAGQPDGPEARRFPSSFWPFGLLPPLLAGAVLRLWNLPAQVLGGDELHTVRIAATRPLGEVLTTYRAADPSLPLAGLYRGLLDLGVPLSELGLRLPVLLCGLLLITVLPLLLAPHCGRRTALWLAWLLALSTPFVLYSRIVRAYAPAVLLAACAAAAFWAWWETGRHGWGALCIGSAALALWFHLGTAPLIAGLFLFALGDLALRPVRPVRLRELAGLGFVLAAASALFLVLAGGSLVRLVTLKHVPEPFPWSAVPAVLQFQAGTASAAVAVAFWTTALLGGGILLRDRPRLGAFALTLAVAQAVGIALLAPAGIASPWVLSRYLLPALPFVLLAVAHLFGREWSGRHDRLGLIGRVVPGLAGALLLAALALTGPFADPRFRHSSFQHHDDLAWGLGGRATVPAAAVPAFYRQLAAVVDSGGGEKGAVIEAPWPFLWRLRAFYLYQEVHGRPVQTATALPFVGRPGMALRMSVAAQPEDLCATGARYLIVHRDLGKEEARIAPPPGRAGGPLPPALRLRLRREAGRLARQLRQRWGPPVAADRDLRVWDLALSCPGEPR